MKYYSATPSGLLRLGRDATIKVEHCPDSDVCRVVLDETMDAACIDLGRGAFAHGQTYVALSRLTSAAGLYLTQPLTRSDLLLDPDVIEFCKLHTV